MPTTAWDLSSRTFGLRAEGADLDHIRVIRSHSAAAAAGVQSGDFIVAINGVSVRAAADAHTGVIDHVEIRKRIASADRPLCVTFLRNPAGSAVQDSEQQRSCCCKSCAMFYPWCLRGCCWTFSSTESYENETMVSDC